jgi:hypothetical protein
MQVGSPKIGRGEAGDFSIGQQEQRTAGQRSFSVCSGMSFCSEALIEASWWKT